MDWMEVKPTRGAYRAAAEVGDASAPSWLRSDQFQEKPRLSCTSFLALATQTCWYWFGKRLIDGCLEATGVLCPSGRLPKEPLLALVAHSRMDQADNTKAPDYP